MPHRRLLPTVLPLCGLLACAGTGRLTDDATDYYSPTIIRYADHVYDPLVRAVQLYKVGFELSAPILELGSTDELELRFDDLRPTTQSLSYTLEHCNADWTPSDLAKGQYIVGGFTDLIAAPRQSYNTFQNFFHYSVTVPNTMMRPTLSGNYILKVFRDGNEEDLVLTRRFLVAEQKVAIQARVVASRDVAVRDIAQQVDLTLRHSGITVADPFSDLKVVVLQNMNWSDARTGLKPKFIRNDELIYDHPPEAQFLAGNEFRNFDLKDLRFPTINVTSISTGTDLMEAQLALNPARHIRVYLDQPDINGRFLIRNDYVDGDPLGADYVNVTFSLPLDAPVANAEVYALGGFSDFECHKEMRMQWMPNERRYMLRAPLKQGFYDYVFAVLPNGADKPDLTTLEGSHFQTENDYVVLVYLRDFAQRCDKLVGVKFLNSRRDG
ncbi:MAG: DUF5103 domain-containing protein [Flavobacteriales bacterium]|nr:DUF5103 domain-containing protein [Flavobacteriales bacterium]